MTVRSVEAVWVWRYTTAPFKAAYGRISGSKSHTKDYLQASGKCAEVLEVVFARQPRQAGQAPIAFEYRWPRGSRPGSLNEGGDYASQGRLNLRWDYDNAPDPWKLFPASDPNPIKTFLGDPTHTTESDANQEWATFEQQQFDPWIVVVKLHGEDGVLHARAYLGKPPQGLEHTDTARLPEQVRSAMAGVPATGGCAVFHSTVRLRAGKVVNDVLQALDSGPNVLLTGPPGTGKTVGLEDLRLALDEASELVLFDPSEPHDCWMPAAKIRSVVFHPSYTYEEFVLGLLPEPAGTGGVQLVAHPGPLLSLAHWSNEAGNWGYLFIDEFNRGSAAGIFGDTLALLDQEKRHDPAAGLLGAVVDRAYPGLPVEVPAEFTTSSGRAVPEQLRFSPRLKIVAAVNSSDRSVAPLDAAMRRRLAIVPVRPDLSVLAAQYGLTGVPTARPKGDPSTWQRDDVLGVAVLVLQSLNERIELVLGEDFLLGHALLWGVAGSDRDSVAASLAAAFDRYIAGTLRMTFVDQDEPLAAVLGVGPAPAAPPSSPLATPQVAEWILPPEGLEAVAVPRLRIHSLGAMLPTNALEALTELL